MRRIFQRPPANDTLSYQTGQILHQILTAFVLSAVALALFQLLHPQVNLSLFIMDVSAVILFYSLLMLNRRGYTGLAAGLTISLSWVLIAYITINEATLTNPWYTSSVLVVLLAGFISGRLAGYITAGLTVGLGFLLTLTQPTTQNVDTLVVYTILLTLTAGLQDALLRAVQDAISIARSKNIESARATQRHQRVASELQKIYNNSLDMICLSDHAGRFQSVSPACQRILGYTPEEIQGRSFQEFLHPEDREATLEIFATHESSQTIVHFRNRYLHKDGHTRWLSWISQPFEDHIFGIARDITQLVAYEEKQKQAAQTAERDRMINTISHQFRNPLSVIKLSIDTLKRYNHLLSDAKREEHHHRMSTNVEKLTALTDQLLVFNKLDNESIHLKLSRIDFHMMCEAAVEQARTIADEQQTITLDYQAKNRYIEVDTKLMDYILDNLLGNAIKYAPAGNIRLTIKQNDPASYLKIIVQDDGIGIPEEDQEKLFEPFERASNTTEIQGSGMGLAIVYESVILHNGEITLQSAPGKGTTFTINLPIQQTSRQSA